MILGVDLAVAVRADVLADVGLGAVAVLGVVVHAGDGAEGVAGVHRVVIEQHEEVLGCGVLIVAGDGDVSRRHARQQHPRLELLEHRGPRGGGGQPPASPFGSGCRALVRIFDAGG